MNNWLNRILLFVFLFCSFSLKAQDQSDTTQYDDYYIVSVAEGYDYLEIKKIERDAAKLAGLKIDELGKTYHKEKGIIVPEKCDDEMYCGTYYPRRPFDEESFLSVEMKYAYADISSNNMKMILVAGIFSKEEDAKMLLSKLKKEFPTACYFKARLFLGCMH